MELFYEQLLKYLRVVVQMGKRSPSTRQCSGWRGTDDIAFWMQDSDDAVMKAWWRTMAQHWKCGGSR